MHKFVVFTLLVCMVGGTFTWAQENALPPAVVPNTEIFTLTAAANGHEYLISISLPGAYQAMKTLPYPVLYLLDPDLTFGTVSSMTQLLAPDELPALIVVGVGYASGNFRGDDYDVDDTKFLQFISDELIPYIDSHYRTIPADRALVGYSLGGQFVLHTLASKPGLFYRYVAISPSVPFAFGKVLAGTDDAFRADVASNKVKLFIGSGSRENDQVGDRLRAQSYDGLTLTTFTVENGTHRSSLYSALPQGILAVYCGTNDDPIGCGLRVRKGQ